MFVRKALQQQLHASLTPWHGIILVKSSAATLAASRFIALEGRHKYSIGTAPMDVAYARSEDPRPQVKIRCEVEKAPQALANGTSPEALVLEN